MISPRERRPAAIVYFSATISTFACSLAWIDALARILFPMGRYEFIHRSMGAVHERYRTPHLAVTVACVMTITIELMLARVTPLNAFGCTATFGTFGFVLVYLLTCIAAPVELAGCGELPPGRLLAGLAGVALMGFVAIGSLVPIPPYPYRLLPYLFAAYLAMSAGWYAVLSALVPNAIGGLQLDLEN